MKSFLVLTALLTMTVPSEAHDWYTGQKNEKGLACCGGYDCAGNANWRVTQTQDGYDVAIIPGTHPSVHVEDRSYNSGSMYGAKGVEVKIPGFGSAPVVFHFKGNPGLSPDGDVHACITPYDATHRTITCLFLGGLT